MQRTMVLDLDGTLADSLPDLLAAVNRSLAAHGLAPMARADLAPLVGDGGGVLLRRAFEQHGAVASDADVSSFVDDYALHLAEATVPFAGARETLERFRASGWVLAVCTNKPVAPAVALLRRLELDGYFAAVCGGDSFSTRKPDPGHLAGTIAAAGGEPGGAVMAGDHANDVATARGLGVPAIFAAWGYGPPAMAEGAAAVAHDISELPGIAGRLMGLTKPS